jgi:NAD(P)-dependent dehydrogenase (short-subunit alcohol dehydrogenase family)
MNRVAGKVAIVTGAASRNGIGFATAKLLLDEGAAVVLSDVSPAVRERASELGPNAIGLEHDVADEQQWIAVISEATERFGGVDIVVNNAGITLRGPVDELSLETWKRVNEVNLTGTFLGCKHAVSTMRSQGRGGAIVNLGSISGIVGIRGSGAYGASKGGIAMLTRVVALETAREGIRCNLVYPGMIRSDIHTPVMEATPDLHRQIVDSIPMGRMGEPVDIAQPILFLASDEARYVTGSILGADGGYTAQ